MKKIKITVLRKSEYLDLSNIYENKIKDPCLIKEGDIFYSYKGEKPIHLCDSAYQTLYPFIKDLLDGKNNFYDGWMKNKDSALISCNDGFRPVSFLIELIDE